VAAEVFAFGALLNSFSMPGSINIIDGFASPQDAKDNITRGFKSAKLSPYVCRIAKGRYVFNNQEYKIGKFYMGEEAIHGLLYDAVFEIIDSDANDDYAVVKLEHHYAKEGEGYPYNYTCTVNYKLEKNNQLSIETILKNNSGDSMPLSDGWHPYFAPGASINELLFQMNADSMLEFSDDLVPTGNIIPYTKFQQPELFDNTFLDNCFLLKENNKPACVLKNTKSGLTLTIQPDSSYPYLQLYTPEHRKSIAIENLSSAPDAFNNKIGLKILSPGENCSFKTVYQLSVEL